MQPRRPVIVFDGDCAFCTSSVAFLRARVRPDADIVPWQWAELDALGLTEQECRRAVQWVAADGTVSAGGRAVTAILLAGDRGWPVLGRLAGLRGARRLVDRAYDVVAANRSRLPGGTPACRLP